MTTQLHPIDLDGRQLWLPVPSLRPHQDDAIRQVLTGLKDHKVVFLDAPTGAGKTIIGEAVRQLWTNHGLYVCTTKTLQDQVEADFHNANVIKGRANYPTLDDPDAFDRPYPRNISAANCTRTAISNLDLPFCDACDDYLPSAQTEEHRVPHCFHCHPTSACPYEVAKERAIYSRFAIANTAYYLTEANYVGRFGVQETNDGRIHYPFPLVIMDEADTLESVLMSFIELALSPRIIKKYGLTPEPEYVTKPESWIEWCRASEKVMSDVVAALQPNPRTDLMGEQKKDYEAAASTLSRIASVRMSVEAEPDGWVLDRKKGLSLKPVTIGTKARSIVWRHAPSWLLMSATLISPHQMADDLGLQDHEWTSVRVDSNFPPERRPIIIRATASVTHKTKDEAYPKIAQGVAKILDAHQGERILVHTVSYDLTTQLRSMLSGLGYSPRLLTYTNAREREEALAAYKRRTDSVLIAPSLDRGVDLPDDLCRVIVIAKVPFPNLGDPVVQKRVYGTQMGNRWFATQTVRSLVQMTGRGMRHQSDYVTTYILDDQFRLNIWRNARSRNLIPKWWSSALHWENPTI